MRSTTTRRPAAIRRLLATGIVAGVIGGFVATAPADAAPNSEVPYPVFSGSEHPVPDTGTGYDVHNQLQAIFEADLAAGAGSDTDHDFWIDRMLARAGTAGSFGDTNQWLFSRGRAVFMKEHDPSVLGFGGQVAYFEAIDNRGAYAITVSTGGADLTLTEDTSQRKQTPSYWRSVFTTSNAALQIAETKFITDSNVAVTEVELRNSGAATTVSLTASSPYATTVNGDELTGVVKAPGDVTTVYPRLSGDGFTAGADGLHADVSVPAGGSAVTKVQLGFVTPEIPASRTDYDIYRAATPQDAYTTHVTAYNKWWADNVPYIDTPEDNIDKTLFYRWWLMRFNFLDANMPGNTYQFPTSVEGALGYNNNIDLTAGMFIDDLKYFRNPIYSYGPWVTTGETSQGGAFRDNPGDPANWSASHTQYIAEAGWRSYELHGGPASIAQKLATYANGDLHGQLADLDSNDNYLLDTNWNAWTGNDADAVSFDWRPGTRLDRPESAYLYGEARAAAKAYRLAGDDENATAMDELADKVQHAILTLLWEPEQSSPDSAGLKGNLFKSRDATNGDLNPWKEINNYYPFTEGVVPTPGSADHDQPYDKALRLFADDAQFPVFPFYTANQADKAAAAAAGHPGSNNFSIINSTVQFNLFSSVLRNYPTDAITPELYKKLLYWNAWAQYQNGGDNRLPDANEFWSDGSADPQKIGYRSWIHHTILGATNFTMIEDAMGLRPRDDAKVELDPIDIGWDHFTANNIRYRDSDLTITWDEPGDGKRYYGDDVPEGYSVFLDGSLAFTVDALDHVVYDPATGDVNVDGDAKVVSAVTASVDAPQQVVYPSDARVVGLFAKAGVNIDPAADSTSDLARGADVTASFSAKGRGPAGAVDGTTINEPFWGTAGSPNDTDWIQLDLAEPTEIDDARVYFYQTSTSATVDGYAEPQSYTIQYLDGDEWKPVPAQAKTPQYPQANYNRVQFPAITTSKIRVQVAHAPGLKTGIKEVQLYDTGIAAPPVSNQPPFVDAWRASGARVAGQASLVGTVKDDGLPDGTVTSTWSVVSTPEGGQAIFEDASSPSTVVRFTAAGDYTLSLTADDGEKQASKDVTITGDVATGGVNVAPNATPSAEYTAGWNDVDAINDGDVIYSGGAQTQLWGTWSGDRPASRWVQYDWKNPQRIDKAAMAFWHDTAATNPGDGVTVPESWVLQYWDGGNWVDVAHPSGYPVEENETNTVTFDPVVTTKLRAILNARSNGSTNSAVGVSEWEIYAESPTSIEPVDVRTSVGELPTLPETVIGVYDDGTRAALPVTWPEVTADQVAADGMFTVTGIVDGSPLPATATVWVRATPPGAITTIDPVAVTTQAGVKPQLPDTVTVQYNDGSKQSGIAVTWSDIDAGDYAEPGTFTVTGTVDGAPQDAVATVTVVAAPDETDTTKPQVTITTDPKAGPSGWFASDVSVSVTATDDKDPAPAAQIDVDGAGWTDYAGPVTVSGEGVHVVKARATDVSGNVSTVQQQSVSIDLTAPGVTAAPDASARTVKLQAADGGSGVAGIEYRLGDGEWMPYRKTISVPLTAVTLQARATDAAGNVSEPITVDVPAADDTVHRNVALFATPTASYTAPWNSVDGLNDDVQPAKSGDTNPSDNANVWGAWPQIGQQWVQYDWDQPVSVNEARVYFVANLDANGLGIDVPKSWSLQYWDDTMGDWADVPNPTEFGRDVDTYNVVTFDAVTTTKLRMLMTASGTEEQAGSLGVKEWQVYEATTPAPDTQAPVVQASVDPATPASGWHTGEVTVTASAIDNRDGMPAIEWAAGDDAWTAYTDPVAIDDDGVITLRFRATDAAGNVSEVASVEVRRDATAPQVTAKADETARTVTLDADDATSGIASVDYRVGDGEWQAYVEPVTVGPDAVTVAFRATDAAGNVSKAGSVDVPAASTTPTTPPDEGPGTATGHEKLHLGVTSVAPGGVLPVTITGGNAGAVFELSLHSDPVALGTVTLGDDGMGTAVVTIPVNVTSGTHELWATLGDAALKAPIAIVAPGTSSDEEALAHTGGGFDPMPYLPYGIALLLIGAAAVTLVTLRRRCA